MMRILGSCAAILARASAVFALILLAAPVCLAVAAITPAEYQARRNKLKQQFEKGVILLAGSVEPEAGDIRNGFWQDPNLLYFSGWQESGAILLIMAGEETLFLPHHSDMRDRYTGHKVSAADEDATARTGFAKLAAEDDLAARFKKYNGKIHTVTSGPGFERLRRQLGERNWVDISQEIGRQRMVKSPEEIAIIERSIAVSIAAHRAALARLSPGLFEYQLGATLTNVALESGCERLAYPTLVGSGVNSTVLHYMSKQRRMDSGDLVVIDMGAECANYAADLTRTVPVSGHFTKRQKEIYEIVLGAQQAALDAARPGMKLAGLSDDSLNGVARAYVAKHGLESYYLHSVGHHVGLEVHDLSDNDAPLAPGMVVTLEPGIYIPEEKIGIRIEDMILITPNGARLLSGALPRDASAVEALVKGHP